MSKALRVKIISDEMDEVLAIAFIKPVRKGQQIRVPGRRGEYLVTYASDPYRDGGKDTQDVFVTGT